MHPHDTRSAVLERVGRGLTDGQIARELGLARTTVRDIRAPRRVHRPRCWRCWQPTRPIDLDAGRYAELLGLYLGDGHVVRAGRTHRLRVSLDARHPQIVADAETLLAGVFPGNRVGLVRADDGATVVPSVYARHLPCLLPQHGPGKKHERPIVLESWQREHVRAAPWSFLRGLVHSDGCFFVNRAGGRAYLSVDFCNASEDVRGLFVDVCARVGVRARPAGDRVRIYRREDVAAFALFVGSKR